MAFRELWILCYSGRDEYHDFRYVCRCFWWIIAFEKNQQTQGKKKQKEKLNHFIIKGIFSINNLHLKFQVVYSCTACKVNLWIFTLAFSFHQDFGDVKCCRLTGQLNDITNQLYSTASGMRRANHQIFRSTNSSPKSDRQCIVTSNLKLVQIAKKIC